jgi:hypothetical protein
VWLVFTAERAKLLQLNAFRRGFLILGVAVILPLALTTLQGNDFPHNAFLLGQNFRNRAGAHGASAFAYRKP